MTPHRPPYMSLHISQAALEQAYPLHTISRREAIGCGLTLAKAPKVGTSWSYNNSLGKTREWPLLPLPGLILPPEPLHWLLVLTIST